jgi:putative spermidine/putrescine transport system substrate-binding protein
MQQNGESRDRDPWRRASVVAVVVLVLAVAVAGCGSSNDKASTKSTATPAGSQTTASGLPNLKGTTISYIGVGGTTDEAMQKAWFKPFEQATGAKVTLDSPTDYTKLQVQEQSGNVTYDLVDGDAFVMDPGCGKSWEPLTNVPNATKALAAYKPKSQCTVPDYVYSYVIGYSPKLFPNGGPQNCGDVFDTAKFPGKRQFWSYYYGGPPECAAMAAGASSGNLYPLDQNAVANKLKSIKGDIRLFDTSQQAVDAMSNNDVSMGIYTTRMVLAANKAGAGWKIAHGWSSTGNGTFGIPKNAPHKDAAEALLNYIMDPVNNKRFTEILPAYGSVASAEPPQSASKLDPWLVSGSKPILDAGTLIDWNWWAANDKPFSQKWLAATTG